MERRRGREGGERERGGGRRILLKKSSGGSGDIDFTEGSKSRNISGLWVLIVAFKLIILC